MRTLFVTCAFLAFGLGVPGQNVVWNAVSDPYREFGDGYPWGREDSRTQVIVPYSVIGGPAMIQDLVIVGSGQDTPAEIVYGDVEVRLGITRLAEAGPSWQANNPHGVTVHRGRLRYRIAVGEGRGLGLPEPYAFLPSDSGDHLCVDIIVRHIEDRAGLGRVPLLGVKASGVARAFHPNWTMVPNGAPFVDRSGPQIGLLLDDGEFIDALGHGCPDSRGIAPVLTHRSSAGGNPYPQTGQTFPVRLANALPGAAAVLHCGYDAYGWWSRPGSGKSPLSPSQFPVPLDPYGAPGCRLWHDVFASSRPVRVSSNGDAAIGIHVPNDPRLYGLRTVWSWVVYDARANAAGLVTSNYGLFVVGR